MEMSESIKEISAALIKFQAAMPKLKKDASNPFFKSKYVELATLAEATIPILTENKLGFSQFVGENQEGKTTLTTMIFHETGEWLRDTMPLLMIKPDPQGQGSAITYARRYALMAALGIVADVDDDGNAASDQKQTKAQIRENAPSRTVEEYESGNFCKKCNSEDIVIAVSGETSKHPGREYYKCQTCKGFSHWKGAE